MKIALFILGYIAISFAVCCFVGKFINHGMNGLQTPKQGS